LKKNAPALSKTRFHAGFLSFLANNALFSYFRHRSWRPRAWREYSTPCQERETRQRVATQRVIVTFGK
jgi:hypothetical protein